MQDNQLYQAIRNNDKEAFELLFDKYYPRLCFFSMQFSVDKEAAEEVVSDVFLKLWNNRKKNEVKHLLPFLYTSVKNTTLNFKKSSRRHLWLEDDDYLVDEENQESKIIVREELENIQKIIARMPPKRRTIFMLNRMDGLKYKEIAEIMNISVHTVQNQMVLAVKFLYDQFPDKKIKDSL
ncbi:RNA polymerase sigma-70 factor [Zobellia alginiliquefaciens]|uniref:RNA polymerase sigma-70 factor n=1 Tax=Zobellia alginiliquefaciens TaxID=3032586 RepID=UPI0023E0B9CF|nr:RNA polymerase sigma-70 factor [Zobellia alginiliquefaciens]